MPKIYVCEYYIETEAVLCPLILKILLRMHINLQTPLVSSILKLQPFMTLY